MLDLLRQGQSQHDWKVVVAHVNHGLRGIESDADEALVRDYCAQHSLPLEVKRLASPPSTGVEAWGRRQRLAFFQQLAGRDPGSCVVLAHHGRDLVETMLLHLLRGCGPAGLVGMRPCTEIDGVSVLRPMLYCLADFKEYCRDHGVPFREDTSNRDLAPLRNRIRHVLVPLFIEACGPDFLSRWVEVARLMALEEDAWREKLAPLLQEPPTVSELSAMPRPLRLRFLYQLLRQQANWPDQRRVLLALADKLEDPEPQWSLSVGGGFRFARRYETWSLSRAEAPTGDWLCTARGWRHSTRSWEIHRSEIEAVDVHPPDAWTAYLAPGGHIAGLCVRTRRPGDRIRLLDGSTRKLKKLMIDARIPLEERRCWPVVVFGDQVVWVPGLARSDAFLLPPAGGPAVVLAATGGLVQRRKGN
ncbi:tRNA lysidine(34) synthetase TilS [bacterium]|nr:tRNA lysidine(34) synthetase TilS [bacterium]